MSEIDKSKLPPRDLCRAYLLDAANALRAARPIAETLPEKDVGPLLYAISDALGLVATMLNAFQHADDMRAAQLDAQRKRIYRILGSQELVP